ncbi:peptidoglycan DD-metalloendopeptidase family protein [Candidatus Poribacteria bacterium]|nr:peptidoglycan DD-metalloendopeptidase family protein [Candidatus Poribacteria bacterium]MBT5536592.1 peptidoglycan DD-metalloendopeptidase family protein [Candidatus Poribacteria bacterium]MBT5713042.1 peptidoglycan DD-metalloendopeptidase family protein [Candidatus Poribacteria bacterium]MBT7100813.1 peptidoglycan DD-metalloendopeptidase family protein [Candidatus Poribacteria bacterium]MBT7805888.1 peptidoglycan DD-metalloendopeptidase family protein [Candidatus Poribacteria bacterium]
MAILAFGVSAPLSAQRDDAGSRLRRAEQQREQKVRELREAETALEDAVSREKSVLGALHKLDRRTDATRKEIRAARKAVTVIENRIQATEVKIAALVEQQDARRELVRRRIRANYKINYLTPDGLFAMAVGQGHLQDTLVRLRYVAAIREKDDEIVRGFVEDQKALTVERESLAAEKVALTAQQATLLAREKSLQVERKARADGLAAARGNRATWSKTVRAVGAEARKLRDLVGTLSRAQRSGARRPSRAPRRARPAVVNKPTAEMALRAQPSGASRVNLDWPVAGTVVNNASSELEGITIRCAEGTSVNAIQAGTVEYAEWFDGLGFGKLLVLNHGDGLRSFYAHLQEFSVTKGDIVAGGQTVGVSGSTGSLLGPALYFEMRHHFDVVSFAEDRP